jgi:hypothetical protein
MEKKPDEIPIFTRFVERGLALPASDFFKGLLDYYGIEYLNLNPSGIFHVSVFVLLCKLRCFLVGSLKTCMLTLRSSGHLESCSSRVLTLVGLHDLLPKCLVNLSRKAPL